MKNNSTLIHGYHLGWHKDDLDPRDFKFAAPFEVIKALPDNTDLEPNFPPVLDQLQLGCHDENTEVLTEHGWVYWKNYEGHDLLATINPQTKMLEYQEPLALQQYEYDGLMYYANHKSVDFALTPNHRMYQRRWNEAARTLSNDYSFIEIQKAGWYYGLLDSPAGFDSPGLIYEYNKGTALTGDDFVRLIALVISDGWVGGTDSNWNSVSFCCFDERYEKVAEFARRTGINEQPSRRGVWKFQAPKLAAWFRANAYVDNHYDSAHKRVPNVIRECNQEQLHTFFEFFGDRSVDWNAFYSVSKHLIDDLQEMLLKVGYLSSVYSRAPRSNEMLDGRVIQGRNPEYTLTIHQTPNLSIERKSNIETEHYKGPVYCATVPNSTLITRRNDSVFISGNSCTANAASVAFDYARKRQGLSFINPSRLYIYYNERVIEGTVSSDAGAQLRDAIKTLNQQGACAETLWPYDITKFASKPPDVAYASGAKDVLTQYMNVTQTEQQLMGALAAGYAVIFGFMVYNSFEQIGSSGVVPMPNTKDKQQGPLGGHANCLCGYEHVGNQLYFKSRNSWGTNFGDKGNVWFPSSYLTNGQLSSDFWAVEVIADSSTPPAPPTPSPYYVGPGIATKMLDNNDQPASSEWYPKEADGSDHGFSMAYGQSGKMYVYIKSLDKVEVY